MAKKRAVDAAKERPADAGGKGGRPPWEPTDQQRGEVRAFTVAGYTQEQIADYLGVDAKTLREHCRGELDFATMKVIANAAGNVVRLANGVPAEFDDKGNCTRAEIPMSLGPNAFILKTRGKKLGWSERLELTGKDGDPLMPDLTGLTNEQLEVLAEAERIIASIAPEAGRVARAGETTH